VDDAKERVADATRQAKGMASAQKDLLAEQLDEVASAVGRVADDMEQQSGPSAPYIRMLADNAGKLSETVRSNDVDQILSIAQDFGRKQPVAFLGAAALLGFAASRFITASAKRAAASTQVGDDTAPDTGVTTTAASSAPSLDAGGL
jgi:hypothetical protein